MATPLNPLQTLIGALAGAGVGLGCILIGLQSDHPRLLIAVTALSGGLGTVAAIRGTQRSIAPSQPSYSGDRAQLRLGGDSALLGLTASQSEAIIRLKSHLARTGDMETLVELEMAFPTLMEAQPYDRI